MLGRGLADLIPPGGNDAGNQGDIMPGQEIPVAQIHRSLSQPRTNFDEAALAELTDSIRENGILQPILVRPRASGGYEIVAGERRYRAALRAGLKEIPAVVRELSDADTFALALIENLIREDIGPLETARAFHKLMEEYGWTQEEMGRRVGKSRSAVANSLRLLSLPEAICRSLEAGEISEGHARSLIGDERDRQNPVFSSRQMAAWRQVVERGLSVRDAERLMRDNRPSSPPSPMPRTPSEASGNGKDGELSGEASALELRALEDRFRTALGTRVRLVGNGRRGRIEIEFFSPDELDALLTRFERP